MKRSARVQLVMLGSAVGVAGCDTREPIQQQTYASQQQCRRDWGDPPDCKQNADHGGVYFGPRYYWDRDRNRPVVVEGDGSERVALNSRVSSAGSFEGSTHAAGSISRGGFGGIGRGFGGGE